MTDDPKPVAPSEPVAPSPAPEPPEPPVDKPDAGDSFSPEYVRKLRSEAAEHRKAARQAQEELERARGELDAKTASEKQRALTEALTEANGAPGGSRMADVNDLLLHVQPAELVDDDGNPVAGKIESAISRLLEAKPHLAAPRPSADGGARGLSTDGSELDFGSMLRRAAGAG